MGCLQRLIHAPFDPGISGGHPSRLLFLEVLALRQQVAVLKRRRPRPSLNRLDCFFWTALRHICFDGPMFWIVKPETVVGRQGG
jgi:hypothetical protein